MPAQLCAAMLLAITSSCCCCHAQAFSILFWSLTLVVTIKYSE
jgi:K+ transporter